MAMREVVWARQGTPVWEQWWVQSRGKTRSHEPTRDEHVSFANYDLRRFGLPDLQVRDGRLFIDTGQGNDAAIAQVIAQHGFEWA
jgi:hypothetical protein